jgi:hypothetical protein
MTDPTPNPQAADPAQAAGKIAQDIETIADNVAEATQIVAKANWWTALVGLCTALPGIIQLAKRFWDWLDRVSGGNPGTFIANFGADMSALMDAKSKEEKQNALQKIANRLGHLP